MNTLSNLAHRDIETVIHPFTNLSAHRNVGPLVIEEARGIYIYDNEGKEYIEGMSGLWCSSLGYGNSELVEVAAEQMQKLSFTHLFGHKTHDSAIALSEKLKELVPCDASKVLFCGSGSEANDMQVKLTWYYNNARGKPEKKKIIARIDGYHGVSVAAGSLTGLPPVHAEFDLPIDNILHTSSPHYYHHARDGETEAEFTDRLVDDLEELINREGAETIAAFIAEPVLGAGGVVPPPEGYFPKISALLRKYDIRMISDEVICGFGRTGNWFGAQTHDYLPDSVSMAKAITSAYFPLGAITIEEDMYQAMLVQSEKLGGFAHGFTYTGHPVGTAVALKTLEIYERDGIIAHAAEMSKIFKSRLDALADHELVGDVRYSGMVGAIELVADKKTRRAFDPKQLVGMNMVSNAQNHGLISRAMGDAVSLCPPLTIKEDELNELFDRYEKALNETTQHVTKQGLRAAI